MKNILLITAHPSSQGFTHTIAKRYTQYAQEKENTVFEINVYAPEWKQDFLSFESVKDIPYDEKREKIQEKIRWADEIVCVCPLWWMDTPAILKNFFDTNFTAGFAYKYENGYPKGLLSPKTAQMVFTCDANKWLFLLLGFPFYMLWRFARFGFCGISLKNLLVFDKKRKRSEQEHEDFLKALKNRLF